MILESLSRRIATKIKEADPEGPGSVAVLEYGIGLKLNLYAGVLLTLLFGWIISDMMHSMLALLSFMAYRKFSGGFHLPITVCSLVTGLGAAILPVIPLNQGAVFTLTLLSVFIALAFAPNNYEELYNVKYDSWSKIISVLIVSANFLWGSSILALSFAIQSLLILPVYPRKGGDEA